MKYSEQGKKHYPGPGHMPDYGMMPDFDYGADIPCPPGGYMPGYGMPGMPGMPGYGMPGYGMPDYGMPGYGMPGYGMPDYAGPGMPCYPGDAETAALVREIHGMTSDIKRLCQEMHHMMQMHKKMPKG